MGVVSWGGGPGGRRRTGPCIRRVGARASAIGAIDERMRRLVSALALAAAVLLLAAPAQAVTKKTARFVASFEGFYSCVYADPAGHATIGYGHLIHYGPPTKKDRRKWGCLTKARALRLLRRDLAATEREVFARIEGAKVTPSMVTALTSFAFNLGAGALDRQKHRGSGRFTNISRNVRLGRYRRAGKQMLLYDGVIINGKRRELKGLQIRRRKEYRLMVRDIDKAKSCVAACPGTDGADDSGNGGNGGGTGGGLPVG